MSEFSVELQQMLWLMDAEAVGGLGFAVFSQSLARDAVGGHNDHNQACGVGERVFRVHVQCMQCLPYAAQKLLYVASTLRSVSGSGGLTHYVSSSNFS